MPGCMPLDGSLGFQPSFSVGRVMYSPVVLARSALLTYLSLPFAVAVVCAWQIPVAARPGIVAHADCAVACRCCRMALIQRRCSLILGVVFNVKEFHVLSLTCSQCGHGTIFDFIRFQD